MEKFGQGVATSQGSGKIFRLRHTGSKKLYG
jgi:hypothetical protein